LQNEVINDPKSFFDELGGLHDACVENFSWDMKRKALCISVDDLNSNFLDLPEYQGLRAVDIIFIGVVTVDVNVQILDDIFRVYDMDFINENETYEVKIDCSPGGYFKCKCRAIELRNIIKAK
jgi:hypothetical protein